MGPLFVGSSLCLKTPDCEKKRDVHISITVVNSVINHEDTEAQPTQPRESTTSGERPSKRATSAQQDDFISDGFDSASDNYDFGHLEQRTTQ